MFGFQVHLRSDNDVLLGQTLIFLLITLFVIKKLVESVLIFGQFLVIFLFIAFNVIRRFVGSSTV